MPIMDTRSAWWFCLGQGLLDGNEKAAIKYCRWLLRLSPEDRKRHRDCFGRLYYSHKNAACGADLSGRGDCPCAYCEDAYRTAISEHRYLEERARNSPHPEKKAAKKTNIYVMRNERNGLVKIGRSQSPIYREATLQGEEPEITMLFHFPATEDVETILHGLFAEYRVRGEWFCISDKEINYIRKYFATESAVIA